MILPASLQSRRTGRWRPALRLACALQTLWLAIAPVWAAPPEPALDATPPSRGGFAVPAGALEDALNTFARQAGITLSFDPLMVTGRSTQALHGASSVAEGLAALLAPHGLEAVRSDGGAYLVRPAPPVAAEAHLPTLTVTGEAERANGPVQGYVARQSATATQTDTPLIETPRALSVVTREQMDDQAVQTVDQSLRYSAGVLTEVTGYDPRFAALSVRGFAPTEFLDGVRLVSAGQFAGWGVEPQGLERVELLKGPSSVLYGQATAGGVLHMISKRPSLEAVREVAVSAGSHGRYQGSFDLGGALNDDGSLLYRLNGLQRSSGSQTDFTRDDRAYIAPALTWKPSSRTTITLLAEATRDRMTPKSWWPDHALITPNINGRIPVRRFIGEPGVDRYDRQTSSLAYLLEHRFDNGWTFRQNARYLDFNLDYRHVVGIDLDDDERTLQRGVLTSRAFGRTFTLDNQAQKRWRSGSLEHTLLLGLDFQTHASLEDTGFDLAPSLDVFAPVYGMPVAMPATLLKADSMRQLGIYAQDQIRSGPWALNLAARYDIVNSRHLELGEEEQARNDKLTYSAGLLYLAGNGLAPYLSYSTSFTPVPGADYRGVSFQPETGRQFELGLKYQPPGTQALFTFSAFELKKENVATTDKRHFGFQDQTGQVRARGLEFEAVAALSRQLKLVGSYTFLDARVTRDDDPWTIGKRLGRTARNTAALWLDYRLSGEALRGWSVGGGVRYVGKVPADEYNSRFNPGYTVFDAMLRYERGPYTFALNATNLFDKVYVANYGQLYGQGRTLQAKLSYRW